MEFRWIREILLQTKAVLFVLLNIQIMFLYFVGLWVTSSEFKLWQEFLRWIPAYMTSPWLYSLQEQSIQLQFWGIVVSQLSICEVFFQFWEIKYPFSIWTAKNIFQKLIIFPSSIINPAYHVKTQSKSWIVDINKIISPMNEWKLMVCSSEFSLSLQSCHHLQIKLQLCPKQSLIA